MPIYIMGVMIGSDDLFIMSANLYISTYLLITYSIFIYYEF
jgi:hypothetical protein